MKSFNTKTAIFVFAVPALILFTLFVVYPLIPQIIISMQQNDGYKSTGFVGLKNYIDVLKTSETRARLITVGWQPAPSTAEGLRTRMRADTRNLGGIIMMRGIRADS